MRDLQTRTCQRTEVQNSQTEPLLNTTRPPPTTTTNTMTTTTSNYRQTWYRDLLTYV